MLSEPKRYWWFVATVAAVLSVGQAAAAQGEGHDASGAGEADADEADPADPNMNMAEAHMDDERARAHFVAGRSLYDAGSFERAAAEFQEAYELSNRKELLYNIYLSNRDAGNVQPAADALREYLQVMEDIPDRINLEARLRSLDETLARQQQTEQEAEQARQDLEREQREREEEDRRRQAAEESGSALPWIVAAVGAAAIAGGAVTGVLALGTVSDLEDECPNNLCPGNFDELEGDKDDAKTMALLTDVLLFGGGALLVGGVIWALATGSVDAEAPPASASCGPDGCSATIRASF